MGMKYNRRFSPVTFPVMLRLKSIGQMGKLYEDKNIYIGGVSEITDLFKSTDTIPAN